MRFVGSRSGKTLPLLNILSHQPDIDKIYLFPKDPEEPKCQQLTKKSEDAGIKHYDDPKTFYRIFRHYGWCLQYEHFWNFKLQTKSYLLDAENEYISSIFYMILILISWS